MMYRLSVQAGVALGVLGLLSAVAPTVAAAENWGTIKGSIGSPARLIGSKHTIRRYACRMSAGTRLRLSGRTLCGKDLVKARPSISSCSHGPRAGTRPHHGVSAVWEPALDGLTSMSAT